MTPVPVYKLLSERDWNDAFARGQTACALDIADGYVHLSTREQAGDTAERHFAGIGRVRLLRFPAGSLAPLRWEPSRGGELFPHLYGPLEIARADAAWWLVPDEDGNPAFPEVF